MNKGSHTFRKLLSVIGGLITIIFSLLFLSVLLTDKSLLEYGTGICAVFGIFMLLLIAVSAEDILFNLSVNMRKKIASFEHKNLIIPVLEIIINTLSIPVIAIIFIVILAELSSDDPVDKLGTGTTIFLSVIMCIVIADFIAIIRDKHNIINGKVLFMNTNSPYPQQNPFGNQNYPQQNGFGNQGNMQNNVSGMTNFSQQPNYSQNPFTGGTAPSQIPANNFSPTNNGTEKAPGLRRKIMSVVSCVALVGLVVTLLLIEGNSALEGEITDSSDLFTDIAAFFWMIMLAVIHICDVRSVFSEKFRIRVKTAEQKFLALPIAEIVVLILSVISVIWIMISVTFVFFVAILFGGEVIQLLILSWLLAIIMIVNMINITVSKFKVISGRKSSYPNYPQQAYNPQNNFNGNPQQAYNPQNQGISNGYPQQGTYNPFEAQQNFPPQNQGYPQQYGVQNNPQNAYQQNSYGMNGSQQPPVNNPFENNNGF